MRLILRIHSSYIAMILDRVLTLDACRYVGFGSLGITVQAMENQQLRSFAGMHDSHSGVLVVAVDPTSDLYGVMQRDDVITHIGGVEVPAIIGQKKSRAPSEQAQIANDGSIPFRKQARVFFDHLFLDKYVGDVVTLKLWRCGY